MYSKKYTTNVEFWSGNSTYSLLDNGHNTCTT